MSTAQGMTPGFEGSYMGADAKISAQAVMECKICWTPYDPAEGDEHRQVLPGTPFSALPEDWSCPNCDAPREQFLVLDDPGSVAAETSAHMEEAVRALVADFTEIYHAKMRDVPIINKALHVEAVGFRGHGTGYLGVLVSPWFMNLVLLPGREQDWVDLTPGDKENHDFPSGTYEFLHNTRETVGGYKACSLFSPMEAFNSQMQALDTARAVMVALFDENNRAETDRAAEIRATRQAELDAVAEAEAAADAETEEEAKARAVAETEAAKAAILAEAPSRRAVISGGLAGGES
ncbi:[NiFe]-hydrogenase assembly chaperone HybE [Dinoroseobacter sp. S375]|uniref:[NiFe]-hydrogenase assembly chaperone HybE n=1 Tax=Dinoroseobacter sp. S375 TaxID=3415136 RepID=UPI003C7B4DC8